jgi:histidine kinase
MKLRGKLLLSYLVVIGVVLLVVAVAMRLFAPFDFARHVEMVMTGAGQPPPMMGGAGPGPGMAVATGVATGVAIRGNFLRALNRGLILSAVAAVGVAALASWTLSRRIVRPVQEMARASRRISAGHYDERLVTYDADDELGELTRSFNQMAQALDETEQMRQQLIADVSHELSTPLASIKGYMEGLQDGVIAPAPETFDLIQREASRLQRLVRDLQMLSRAEAAQLGMDLRPADAVELARLAVEWLRPQFEEKGVALEADLPEGELSIQADFDRIRQVLSNVLGNALQYTPPGGRVILRLARDGQIARFAVQDTGIGLAAGDLERVFQRFYRVDRSRARSSGGSGIGLTIARHIIEAHGGRLWAESAGPGQGSQFSFTVPLAGG